MSPLHPIVTQCVAGLAASLSSALLVAYFLTTRRLRSRLAAAEADCRRTREFSSDSARQAVAAVDRLATEVRELPPATSPPAVGPPRSGMNLTKRSQILRLHRRGDSPEQIATGLEIPLQEVTLLLKVHHIVLQTQRA